MEQLELKLYSISQAAKLLGISRVTLHSLVEQGRMGIIQINERERISHVELERFLCENTVLKEVAESEDDLDDFMGPRNKKNVKQEIINKDFFNKVLKEVTNG